MIIKALLENNSFIEARSCFFGCTFYAWRSHNRNSLTMKAVCVNKIAFIRSNIAAHSNRHTDLYVDLLTICIGMARPSNLTEIEHVRHSH